MKDILEKETIDMAINIELMNAILSMDSYNRGYNAALDLDNDHNDNNFSSDSDTISIGNAQIDDSLGGLNAQNIGFYGISYQYDSDNDGIKDTTIISYRGR